MLPLRDINPTRRAPVVTYLLIAANLAVFVYQFLVLTAAQSERFVLQHGVVPDYLFSGYGPSLSTPFTSMFMHGGLGHLASNMWFLHVFGDNVEDILGHSRYLFFYLLTGVLSAVAHGLMDPSSHMPLVGASGAISGVLGAYIVMFPARACGHPGDSVFVRGARLLLHLVLVRDSGFLGLWCARPRRRRRAWRSSQY